MVSAQAGCYNEPHLDSAGIRKEKLVALALAKRICVVGTTIDDCRPQGFGDPSDPHCLDFPDEFIGLEISTLHAVRLSSVQAIQCLYGYQRKETPWRHWQSLCTLSIWEYPNARCSSAILTCPWAPAVWGCGVGGRGGNDMSCRDFLSLSAFLNLFAYAYAYTKELFLA